MAKSPLAEAVDLLFKAVSEANKPKRTPERPKSVAQKDFDAMVKRYRGVQAALTDRILEKDRQIQQLQSSLDAAMRSPVHGERPEGDHPEFVKPDDRNAASFESLTSDRRTVDDLKRLISMIEDQQAADVRTISEQMSEIRSLKTSLPMISAKLNNLESVLSKPRFEPGGTGKKFYLCGVFYEKLGGPLMAEIATIDGDAKNVLAHYYAQWEPVG